MIRFLSALGRATVVVGALLTIAGGVIEGYIFGRVQGLGIYEGAYLTIAGRGQITPLELFYAVLDAALGIVVAGVVFGPIATLYDIRDNVRQIPRLPIESANRGIGNDRSRREPYIG